ncbi:MAG TPA: glycosyl hydrolase family 28-related protein [Planctomycetota bacterium]
MLRVAVLFGCCAALSLSAADTIPALNWEPRSDWTNVKQLGATGDGIADDTDAIQKALSAVKPGSTVYLPAGTYRITRTLNLIGPLVGVLVVGHGRDTKLVWDGEAGGKVFKDDGVAYSRFVGLLFDGKNKAAIGFYHYSDTRFETEVRHQHLAFLNFTDAGILAEEKDKFALAETNFENCLFDNCRRGVVFTSFNDYDFTFDGCEFRGAETAIECRHGNFYVRNCHFENSRVVDVLAMPEHGCSIRRSTSVGSNRFLELNNGVTTMTIQDCQVAGWKAADGAIKLAGAPVILFDCVFTGGPGEKERRAPSPAEPRAPSPAEPRAGAPGAPGAPVNIRDGQRLIASENQSPDTKDVIDPAHKGKVYVIPAGRDAGTTSAGQRKGSLRNAQQRFLSDKAHVPGKVFDAKRDFGAKADGKADDTAALQKCIDAARENGKDAIAYLPNGTYVVKETLKLTGTDYFFGGTGFMTKLVWRGAEGGTIVSVNDPENVVLEHLAVGNHDSGPMNNAIDILQTGSDRPSHMTYDGVFVYGMYQKKPLKQGLHFSKLGPQATVVMPHVQGNLRFIDSAQATILANTSFEGSIVVEGKDKRRDGLLGFQTRLATLVTHGLYLKDNHNIVMSDFYVEQADNGFVFEGAPDDPPGRATIQGAKVHFIVPKDDATKGTAMTIGNYSGQIFFGHDQFYCEPTNVRIVQTGDRPLDLFLMGICFYNTRPDIHKTSANVYLVGNAGFKLPEQTTDYKADDNVSPEALAKISAALDDLRRLGETDLKLNHGN